MLETEYERRLYAIKLVGAGETIVAAARAVGRTEQWLHKWHCCIGRLDLRRRDWRDEIARHPHPCPAPPSAFAGYRFPSEVITLAVRWYLRFGLSYRDVEELLADRRIEVDHVTVYRWSRGSHPSSPRVHNTTCPSRRVALLPNDEGALPRPGRKADARAKRVGSPSPISPALFIPTSWPVSSAGNCKRSSRIARPCSPRNGSPT